MRIQSRSSSMLLRGQGPPMPPADDPHHYIHIEAGKVFDTEKKGFLHDQIITVDPETGLIKQCVNRAEFDVGTLRHAKTIDLSDKTIVPGFVDAHAHIMLHSYDVTPSLYQERDESMVQRIVQATNNCRAALKAGYTTYRDLGTEGAFNADVGIRDSINRGIIPGPRMFVVTEALASSGGYEIRQENRNGGTIAPRICDPCDGVDGVRAAVRRRLGAGADLIKFYADYRNRQLRYPPPTWPGSRPVQYPPQSKSMITGVNPSNPLFTQEEMNEICAEATRNRCPVAAHASTPQAVIMAAKAGVTTLEHGTVPDLEALEVMKECGTIFVSTLAVKEVELNGLAADLKWEDVMWQTKKAFDMGIKMACGGDTGAFPHGQNAREMELMVEAGISVEDVLRMCTVGGWEACGGDLCGHRFGKIQKGWCADLVALDGDPTEDISALRKVSWVMKDGNVVVENGRVVD